MTTAFSRYETPVPADTDPTPGVFEIVLIATQEIGGGVMAHAEPFNGAIPGPTLRFNVGDTAIVRLINELDHPTGIHWYGIEFSNSADGPEVTQDPVVTAFPVAPTPPAIAEALWRRPLVA